MIGDPLFTVPVQMDNKAENSICYEIHGEANATFNLVSDICTSVNALYTPMNIPENGNIISEVGVVAVNHQGQCVFINTKLEGCAASVDSTSLGVLETYRSEGISVKKYNSRVRISVPNCENINLVMWVLCQEVGGQKMIKFVVSRGVNLRPTSHGLVGK